MAQVPGDDDGRPTSVSDKDKDKDLLNTSGCDMTESMMSMDIREQHDPSLDHLARAMFEKTAVYLQGELTLVQEDYKLLENLNKATASKYSDMRQISTNVARSLHELNDKYKSLEPHLRQIDQIEDSVNKLEQAAYKLDSYSKRLEAKFKSLEKRQ